MIISVCPLLHHVASEQFHFQMSKLLFSFYCHKIHVFHSSISPLHPPIICAVLPGQRPEPDQHPCLQSEKLVSH